MWSVVATSLGCGVCAARGSGERFASRELSLCGCRASRAESLAVRCVLESEAADASAASDGCDAATARLFAALSRAAWFGPAIAAWLVSEPCCGSACASLIREFGLGDEPEFPAAALGPAC